MTVRIWVPQGLRRKDLSSLAYVVIDELDSGLAGLTVSPWPTLDGLGRLCWWHHLLKTKGWALVGGPGCYRLVPPGNEGGDRAPP